MKFFVIKPEVAGCLGSKTVGNRVVHPPEIEKLQYEFADWTGDDVVSSTGVWIGTERLMEALKLLGLTPAAAD